METIKEIKRGIKKQVERFEIKDRR